MRNPLILIISLLVLSQLSSSFQLDVNLPIPSQLVAKVNLSIRRLQEVLVYFDSPFVIKLMLLNRAIKVRQHLLEMNKALSKFNNVIAGAHNNVTGSRNIVVGNFITLQGNNNWVFVPNYKGNIDGDLVVSKWRIQMDKIGKILFNPKLVISYIDQKKNSQLKANMKYNIENPARLAILPILDLKKIVETPIHLLVGFFNLFKRKL